jgi:hypothetical protein
MSNVWIMRGFHSDVGNVMLMVTLWSIFTSLSEQIYDIISPKKWVKPPMRNEFLVLVLKAGKFKGAWMRSSAHEYG